MGSQAVRTDIRVIYGDTDQMGVVYYANYLRYFEAGRNEYLRARGLLYRQLEKTHRIFLPVVDAQVSYKSSARYDDLLTVETTISRLRRASVHFTYRVLRGDQEIASGHTIHACVGPDGEIEALPADVKLVLAQD